MKRRIHAVVVLIVASSCCAMAEDSAMKRYEARIVTLNQAQQTVLAASKPDATNRVELLAVAQKTCDDLLCIQDGVFARAVVLSARIAFLRGEREKARTLLTDYRKVFEEVTAAMLFEGSRPDFTPQYEAALLRGEMYEAEGGRLLNAGKNSEAPQAFTNALPSYEEALTVAGSVTNAEARVKASEVRKRLMRPPQSETQ
jgi:hypothetical protein